MKTLKYALLSSAFVLISSISFAQQQNYAAESCRTVTQDGSIEPWACRNSTGSIRCYADTELENGAQTRIWGGCVESFSDCWWNGSGRVDACQ